jgi:hypothetical protein
LIKKYVGTGYSEDLDVDGKILLKWAIRERWEWVHDSHLILDAVQRWAPENMEMTFMFPQDMGNFSSGGVPAHSIIFS